MPDGLARALCPHCNKTVGVRPDQFGKRLRCPGCRLAFTFEPEPDAGGDDGVFEAAGDADAGAVVRRGPDRSGSGGGGTSWSKAKVTARFAKPRELVFKAAVQAVRGGRCDVQSLDWANAHVRFTMPLPGGESGHDLFVFEGAGGDSELEITSREGNEDGQFDQPYEALVREVGKYLMFAADPVPPPAPAPLPPRRERDDGDYDRPRYRPRYRRPRRRDEGQGMGIAAFVCGLVACCFFCLWFLSGPLALVAIVLGAIANSKGGRGGKGFAVAGIVLGIVAILLLVLTIFVLAVADREERRRDRFNLTPTPASPVA